LSSSSEIAPVVTAHVTSTSVVPLTVYPATSPPASCVFVEVTWTVTTGAVSLREGNNGADGDVVE
jgi:hypothetical protein